jgi:hypothetical protein
MINFIHIHQKEYVQESSPKMRRHKMTNSDASESAPILIEFSPRPGVETVAVWNEWQKKPEELKRRSEEELNNAMKTIEGMADRISALQKKIPVEFSQVEVEFGIKFDWKVGALLAEAGTEASINVTLTWSRPQAAESK